MWLIGLITLAALLGVESTPAWAGDCRAGLDARVQSYISSYNNAQTFAEAGKLRSHLVAEVIQTQDRSAYIACVQQIDRYSQQAPGAIADLALELQLWWENEYLRNAIAETRTQANIIDRSNFVSVTASRVTFGMYAIRGASQLTPGWFKFILNTGIIGGALSQAYWSTRHSDYPPAPAELMSLGGKVNQSYVNEALFDRTLQEGYSVTAGAAANMVVFYYAGRALLYTGDAAVFLETKPHPASIAAGIALAIMADYVVTDAANAWQNYLNMMQLKGLLISKEEKLLKEQACSFGENYALMKASIEFMGAALKTEAYTNLDFWEAQSKFEKKYLDWNVSENDKAELRKTRLQELIQVVNKRGYGADPFYLRRVAREKIQKHGLQLAQANLQKTPWVLPAFNALTREYNSAKKRQSDLNFDQFLDQSRDRDNQFLVNRMHTRIHAGGPMPSVQPDAVLMEAIAFLEQNQTASGSLSNRYSPYIATLVNRVAKYELLFENTLADKQLTANWDW